MQVCKRLQAWVRTCMSNQWHIFCTAVCVDMDPLACARGYISLIRHIRMKLTIILDEWMDVLCWNKVHIGTVPWILLCAYDAFARWQHMTTHKQMRRQGLKTKWVRPHNCAYLSFAPLSSQAHSVTGVRILLDLSLTLEMDRNGRVSSKGVEQQLLAHIGSEWQHTCKDAKIKTRGGISFWM